MWLCNLRLSIQCTETYGTQTFIATSAQTIPNFLIITITAIYNSWASYLLMYEQEQCIVVSARILQISVVATNYKITNAIMK